MSMVSFTSTTVAGTPTTTLLFVISFSTLNAAIMVI